MTPERWKRIEEVFQMALDLPPGERQSFIAESCAGDEDLCGQVRALVAQHDQAQDFIETPAFSFAALRTNKIPATKPTAMTGAYEDPAIGRRCGAYRIVREIGRGGMGAVYLAERDDSEFNMRVAVKLIKRGMDTDFILRRFRNERQILATLHHPNIARLLDGGTTDDGLPYFVMEYIEGQPIYRYCDERKLTLQERLRLFRRLCDAVHYAHRHHVIHRDIKPSNILVTPDGVPKLLDFGIAKLLNPDLSAEATLDPTATAMRMMTPEYAAPEQVQGLPITPATDVYSLGVLLYELLTGHRPYSLKNRSPHEIARVICEEEPTRPNAVITRPNDLLPAHPPKGHNAETLDYLYWSRGSTVDSLRRELTGDLDNIVMKALRKEPIRRYSSVEELREDISRYMEGRPVSAPPHVSVAPSVSLSGVETHNDNSLAVLPLKLLDARRAEETGDEYLGIGLTDALITRLGSIRRFVVRPTSSVLRFGPDADPIEAGRALSVGYVLDGRIRRAGERIRITVQLLDVESGAAAWAGQFDEKFTDVLSLEDAISAQVAEALVPQMTGGERALLAKRGTHSPEAYEAYMRGRFHFNSFTEGGFAKAIICYHQAIAHDPAYAVAYAGVAEYYNWLGIYGVLPFSECSAAAKEAAARAVELDHMLADGHAALGLATILHDFDWASAEQHLRHAIELNPNHATAHLWYSFQLTMEGRFDEAQRESVRAEELDPLSIITRYNSAWAYYQARRYDESIAVCRHTLDADPLNGMITYCLSLPLSRKGAHDEAINAALKSVEINGRTSHTLARLAGAYSSAGRADEAEAVLREMMDLSRRRYVSPYHLALVHCGMGQTEEALDMLDEALSIGDGWLVWLGVEPQFDLIRAHPRFGELLRRTGNPIAAERTTVPEPSTGSKSVAVLPLKILGPLTTENTGDDYLGVGLADALVTRLSNVRRFVVRPTSSVLRYQGANTDPLEAGRTLGVDYVVDGSVRRADDCVSVSVQLLSVAEGTTRWSDKFDEQFTDVLQLEDSISEMVTGALLPHLTGDERRQLSRGGTDDAEAFKAYLRGRYYWNTFTAEGFAQSLTYYERAITLDPAYALAYTGIADYHLWLGNFGFGSMPPAERAAAAREAAQKAVELDDTLAEAHSTLCIIALSHEYNLAEAERHERRAFELNPRHAFTLAWRSSRLVVEGRLDDALDDARRAVELDPFAQFLQNHYGWMLYQARRYDESIAHYRRLIASEPRDSLMRCCLSYVLRQKKLFTESLSEAQKAYELAGDSTLMLTALGEAYAGAGRRREAEAVLRQLQERAATQYVSPYHLAYLHMHMGEHEQALAQLKRAIEMRDVWALWLGTDPQLDALRDYPKFQELRHTLKLLFGRGRASEAARVDHATSADLPTVQQKPEDVTIAAAEAAPAQAQPEATPPEDGEAQQLYQAARYYATKRTAEGLRQAIERLERAVERAPRFALAYSELADCYALLNWYVEPPPPDAWENARVAANRAVAADDSLAEAHASLGFVKLFYERDWAGAESELRRAIELRPNNPVAHRWYAFSLSAMGRHSEAITEIQRAQELNPRSAVIATAVANVLFLARRYDESIAQCRRALELDSGSVATYVILRWAYEKKGMHEEALAAYEQERVFAGETPTTRAKGAHVLAATGHREEAQRLLNELLSKRDERGVTAYEIAVIYSLLGDLDNAFNCLEQAERERAVGLTFVGVDPHLDALRSDPRYDEVLRRLREGKR